MSEYRTQYADKAVIYAAQKHPEMCWASLMAGGSCAAIPVKDATFLRSIATMLPRPATSGTYLLEGHAASLYYKTTDDAQTVTLPQQGTTFQIIQIDEKTGKMKTLARAKNKTVLSGKGIFWIVKK